MEAYISLFLIAFLAATLLPAYSELAFAGMLAMGYSPFSLWLVATAGNSLGAVVNWFLGRYLLHYQDRKWFPFKGATLARSQRWFQRYGVWSLLMAWAPIGGDALTFIAGMMRIKLWLFIILVTIGKGLRYAVVLGLFEHIRPLL